MSQTVESVPIACAENRLAASVQRSREAWRRLGMRLHSITPSGLAHIMLILGALVTLGRVLMRSAAPLMPLMGWPTLA